MSTRNKYPIKGSNIVVTGGLGFIGSHLIDRLIKEKASKITVIDSMEYGKEENLSSKKGIEVVKFRIGADSIAKLSSHLTNCDYLFHLAARKHNQSVKDLHSVFKTNLIGTGDLFELAGKKGIKKIFFSSSLYAYGSVSYPPMSETHISRPTTIYGISKLCGEHLLKHYSERFGFDCVAARYFFVYGPRQFSGTGYKSVIIKNLERLKLNAPLVVFGDGKQSLDYIYIDDVVEASTMLLRSAVSGDVFNVGSGKATSVNDLCRTMLGLNKGKGTVVYKPEDWTARTTRVANISKIRKAFRWEPLISLDDGIKRTYSWVKKALYE